jgi:hypothetical protein
VVDGRQAVLVAFAKVPTGEGVDLEQAGQVELDETDGSWDRVFERHDVVKDRPNLGVYYWAVLLGGAVVVRAQNDGLDGKRGKG